MTTMLVYNTDDVTGATGDDAADADAEELQTLTKDSDRNQVCEGVCVCDTVVWQQLTT